MKTLKIVGAILVLALVTVGATVATAFAFGWGAQTPYSPMAAIGNTQMVRKLMAPQVLGAYHSN